ncbi:flagellin [Geminicoccaceae bacterium 1502E]|nr:flagellin [Geminicoccaceae bacterium 1502E]
MALTGTTNTAANTAHRYLTANQSQAASSLAKLSSGSRIVKASDDAASLAVGTKIKADVSALRQASINAAQASSLLQIADGGMARISDLLLRMKALAVQAASGSVSDTERGYLNEEFGELQNQIDQIATQTKFNDSVLLDGSAGKSVNNVGTDLTNPGIGVQLSGAANAATYTLAFDGTDTFTLTDTTNTLAYSVQIDATGLGAVYEGTIRFDSAGLQVSLNNFDYTATASGTFDVAGTGNSLTFQVGADNGDDITVNLPDVDATGMGVDSGTINIRTEAAAAVSIQSLGSAIEIISTSRANVGAMMSRFEFVVANLSTSIENLDAARATLMDVDIAAEMTRFTSLQVLTQAGVAMLAQANQMPQNLLRLLQ